MLTNERMKNLYDWYSRSDVQFNIIKHTCRREVAFLIPSYESFDLKKRSTRMLKIHSTQHLSYVCDALNMFKRDTPYNMYVSLAKFKNGIPNQDMSDNMKHRNNKEFYNNLSKEIETYDYVLDIDAKTHEHILHARNTALIICELFDAYKLGYEIRFSGRGFHFYVPMGKFLKYDAEDDFNIYRKYTFLTEMLNKLYSEMIDMNLIYSSVSVIKIPFTIANYENKQYVCMPINKEVLKNFELSNFDYENIKDVKFNTYIKPEFDNTLQVCSFLNVFNFVFKKFNNEIMINKKVNNNGRL